MIGTLYRDRQVLVSATNRFCYNFQSSAYSVSTLGRSRTIELKVKMSMLAFHELPLPRRDAETYGMSTIGDSPKPRQSASCIFFHVASIIILTISIHRVGHELGKTAIPDRSNPNATTISHLRARPQPVLAHSPRINVISDNPNDLLSPLLDPSGHIHLDHGLDDHSLGFITLGNRLGSEQTSFFRRKPVEFEVAFRRDKVGFVERFKGEDGRGRARAIIVGCTR
jgi:hypothetical protein